MRKLKSILLILFSGGYYVVANRGTSFNLPKHKELLEAMQDELEALDIHLEELISEIILEERDNI
jgi:hypothetical protein